jgi:hypothetical protein
MTIKTGWEWPGNLRSPEATFSRAMLIDGLLGDRLIERFAGFAPCFAHLPFRAVRFLSLQPRLDQPADIFS